MSETQLILTESYFSFNEKKYQKDLFKLILIFITTVIFCYFLGNLLSRILFLLFFLAFLKSKNDYFWIAFFILISLSPAGLLPGGTFDEYGRVPLFTIASGYSFTFFEIFTFLAIYKAATPGNSIYKIPFRRNLTVLLIFIMILFAYSLLLGISLNNIILTFRYLVPLSFFFIIPKLLKNPQDYFYLMLLILPFSLLDFSGQAFQLITGNKILVRDISITADQLNQKYTGLGGFRTSISGVLNMFCFIFSLFLFYCKKAPFHYFLFPIAFINYLSVLLTATRGWIIGYTVILLLLLTTTKNSWRYVIMLVSGIVIVFFLFFAFPVIKSQLIKSFERTSTVKMIVEGDLTAGGTVSRITERGPAVMSKFWESPVIGFGFSDEGYKNQDYHVGNQNLLLEGGILEALLILYFLIHFVRVIHSTRRKLHYLNPFKESLNLFIIGLIGILIIHSSSTQIFGFAMGFHSRVFLALFFMSGGFFVNYSVWLEKNPIHYDVKISKT